MSHLLSTRQYVLVGRSNRARLGGVRYPSLRTVPYARVRGDRPKVDASWPIYPVGSHYYEQDIRFRLTPSLYRYLEWAAATHCASALASLTRRCHAAGSMFRILFSHSAGPPHLDAGGGVVIQCGMFRPSVRSGRTAR